MTSPKRFFDFNSYPTIGAGNYGIIVQSTPTEVLKLLKSYENYSLLKKEVTIQTKVHHIFKLYLPEVKVPSPTYYSQDIIQYKQTNYLCGIGMEYVEPPLGYTTQVHTVLGYHGSDIDTVWGMRTADPVSATNPPRGFFASTYTLEDIWEDEGSQMTVELLAYQMGKAHRLMLDNGILPIDLEWVWSKGALWAIDFGLCEFGRADPISFLNSQTSYGLKNDFYVPHKTDRGYEEFMRGYSPYFDLSVL
jgi:hypothetical protein